MTRQTIQLVQTQPKIQLQPSTIEFLSLLENILGHSSELNLKRKLLSTISSYNPSGPIASGCGAPPENPKEIETFKSEEPSVLIDPSHHQRPTSSH